MVPNAVFLNRRALRQVEKQVQGLWQELRDGVKLLAEHDRMQREVIRSMIQRFFNR